MRHTFPTLSESHPAETFPESHDCLRSGDTLQWLSAVTGRAKGLVGLLVVVQTVLSVSSIAFAFVLRRIINMAVDGVQGGFWASLALLVGILLGQIVLSATGRFLSEYTSATVENRFKHRLFSALLTGDYIARQQACIQITAAIYTQARLRTSLFCFLLYQLSLWWVKYRAQPKAINP